MKFHYAALAALATGVLGGALPQDVRTEPAGMLLDRYLSSGLEFHHWVDRMVEDGHLERPREGGNSISLRSDSWYVRIKNAACSKIIGSQPVMKRTKEHFCSWVQKVERIQAKLMEEDVYKVLCANGRECRLGLRTAFDFFAVFDDPQDMTKLCEEMFDQLNHNCINGGVADVEVGDNHTGEKQEGKIEATFGDKSEPRCQETSESACWAHNIDEL
ncbi:hypothetical protein F4778DRAFT_782626 [Xylariomycetidae sp. FL2044]|nr:hypothetical protein F4778DRAFT_782626 [Xylariomycetidae sp. FL2044]